MVVNVLVGLVGPVGSTVQSIEPVDLARAQSMVSAIGDPTRMAILARLRARDHCVCHLVDELGLKQSVVSHHIGILRRAGIIRSYSHQIDRRWLYYQLDRPATASLVNHLEWLVDDADYNPEPLPCGADERENEGEVQTVSAGR